MKGKRKFSRKQAAEIRTLLRKKCRSGRSEQKSIRAQLRRMEFYISDWDNSRRGFTAVDFDDLVKKGQIRISDD